MASTEEIVSDRGPQFILHVWKAFCWLLGMTICHMVTIQRQTAKWSTRYNRWHITSAHIAMTSRTNRVILFPGPCMYKSPSNSPPQGEHPSGAYLGFQPPLFPWTREPSEVPAVDHWFHQSKRVWDSSHSPSESIMPASEPGATCTSYKPRQKV